MTKKEFAEKILRCTSVHFSYVLKGKKNLSYGKAVIASHLLGTNVDLWMDPEAKKEDRMKAWDKIAKTNKKAGVQSDNQKS